MLKKFFLIIAAIDVLAINVVVGMIAYNMFFVPDEAEIFSTPTPQVNATSTPTPQLTSTPSPAATTTVTPTPIIKYITSPTSSPAKSIAYFTIPGSGSGVNVTTWTDVSGSNFYLNTADYSGYKEAFFEATFKLVNGNGKAYVRIYDVTNSREVNNSTLETSSQSLSLTTGGPLVFWAGNNEYKIQIRTLTADTVVYQSGAIKIVTEI